MHGGHTIWDCKYHSQEATMKKLILVLTIFVSTSSIQAGYIAGATTDSFTDVKTYVMKYNTGNVFQGILGDIYDVSLEENTDNLNLSFKFFEFTFDDTIRVQWRVDTNPAHTENWKYDSQKKILNPPSVRVLKQLISEMAKGNYLVIKLGNEHAAKFSLKGSTKNLLLVTQHGKTGKWSSIVKGK